MLERLLILQKKLLTEEGEKCIVINDVLIRNRRRASRNSWRNKEIKEQGVKSVFGEIKAETLKNYTEKLRWMVMNLTNKCLKEKQELYVIITLKKKIIEV